MPPALDRLFRRTPVRVGLIAALATGIACLRLGHGPLGVLWAEDGSPFLQDANRFGGLAVPLRPYGGYVHLLPRLIAALVVLLPVDAFAAAANVLSCAVAGTVAASTFVLSRPVAAAPVIRATLAAVVVLLPVAPVEVLGNLANLHSYALWLVPWLLLAAPSTPRGSAALGAAGLLIALTEIQTVLFAPFFLLAARDRRQWPTLLGLGAGLLVQLAAMVIAPRVNATPGTATLEATAKGYLVNGVLSLATEEGRHLHALVMAAGWTAIAAAALLLLAFILHATLIASGRLRWAILMLAYGSLATFAVGYALTPAPDYAHYLEPGFPHLIPLRYAAISSAFLAGAATLAAGQWLRTAWPGLGALALAALWSSFALNFEPDWTWRTGAPAWSKSLDGGVAACRADPARQWMTVPTWPAGIMVELSCRTLEQHRSKARRYSGNAPCAGLRFGSAAAPTVPSANRNSSRAPGRTAAARVSGWPAPSATSANPRSSTFS